MKSIFVVQQGAYSDRSIVAVFSTKPKAEAFVAAMNEEAKQLQKSYYDEPDIEEWPLDERAVETGMVPFRVESNNGSIEVGRVNRVHRAHYSIGMKVDRYPWSGGGKQGDFVAVTVMAKDAEHAVKIAADKFREFVALNPRKQ